MVSAAFYSCSRQELVLIEQASYGTYVSIVTKPYEYPRIRHIQY